MCPKAKLSLTYSNPREESTVAKQLFSGLSSSLLDYVEIPLQWQDQLKILHQCKEGDLLGEVGPLEVMNKRDLVTTSGQH